MKTSTFLLGGSVAANIALIALLATGAATKPTPAPAAAKSAKSAAAHAAGASPTAADVIDPQMWTNLETTGDLHAMMARLQAQGFPPATIRALMAEEVRRQFAPRRAALNMKEHEAPYWTNGRRDPQYDAALRAIMQEQDKATRDLLGPDPASAGEFSANLRRQFPGWSDDKIAALQKIRLDYEQKRADFLSNGRGTMLPADRAQLSALDQQRDAAMAQALGPQDYADYQLRNSNTAQNLRSRLAGFDATEQEFRTLYQLQSDFDQRFGTMYGAPSPDDLRARGEAQRQLEQNIQAALGTDRYTDYQRATDYSYRQTTALVSRLGLPPETANSLWTAQKDFEQQRLALMRSTAPTDRTQIAPQLTTLQQQALARIAPLLGSDAAVEAYRQNGGQWLQPIRPAVSAPPRP